MVKGLNKTKIDWCHYSWPVITGCDSRLDCFSYCYARSIHRRFLKDHPNYNPDFSYKFNSDVLKAPALLKNPAIIFIGSMGEWWHPNVPLADQVAILNEVNACPQHKFICLTKQIKHLKEGVDTWQKDHEKWNDVPGWRADPGDVLPENLWVGTTVSRVEDLHRLEDLRRVRHSKLLVSIEPLLEDVAKADGFSLEGVGWVIVGALGGAGARQPDWLWVSHLCIEAFKRHIPVLVKENYEWNFPRKRPREFPEGFP